VRWLTYLILRSSYPWIEWYVKTEVLTYNQMKALLIWRSSLMICSTTDRDIESRILKWHPLWKIIKSQLMIHQNFTLLPVHRFRRMGSSNWWNPIQVKINSLTLEASTSVIKLIKIIRMISKWTSKQAQWWRVIQLSLSGNRSRHFKVRPHNKYQIKAPLVKIFEVHLRQLSNFMDKGQRINLLLLIMVNLRLETTIPIIKRSIVSKIFKCNIRIMCKKLVTDASCNIKKIFQEKGREIIINLEHWFTKPKRDSIKISNETIFSRIY
jgi:hypothetical protein